MEIILDDNLEEPILVVTHSTIRLLMSPETEIHSAIAAMKIDLNEAQVQELLRLWADPLCKRAFEAGPSWVRIFELNS